MNKPIIGVSSCLLGNNVRFDGGHKKHKLITDCLSDFMQLKSICPEMGIGLSTPRSAIRLQKINNVTRLVQSNDTETDHTNKMNEYSKLVLEKYSDLDGFIFKKGSPSCGVWRVPVVTNNNGQRTYDGTGIFTQKFLELYPWIPVEEEGRLNDPHLSESFFERVYALRRWHDIENADQNLQGFINFHSSHKLMLMARNHREYQQLGQFVAATTAHNLKERRLVYINNFMDVLKLRTSKGKNVNVLMHIMGYLKKKLHPGDKQELISVFDSYRKNKMPLITPITLLQHHLKRYPSLYIQQQHYLAPCPSSSALLTLRTTVQHGY